MSEHLANEELRRRLSECPAGGVWRHRRSGRVYAVRGRAIAEATLEPLVIYEGVAAVPFARPLSEFLEKFEHLEETT
jgi:hypothetical protein